MALLDKSVALVAENIPEAIYKSLTEAVILKHLRISFCVFLTAFKAKPPVLEVLSTLNIKMFLLNSRVLQHEANTCSSYLFY